MVDRYIGFLSFLFISLFVVFLSMVWLLYGIQWGWWVWSFMAGMVYMENRGAIDFHSLFHISIWAMLNLICGLADTLFVLGNHSMVHRDKSSAMLCRSISVWASLCCYSGSTPYLTPCAYMIDTPLLFLFQSFS